VSTSVGQGTIGAHGEDQEETYCLAAQSSPQVDRQILNLDRSEPLSNCGIFCPRASDDIQWGLSGVHSAAYIRLDEKRATTRPVPLVANRLTERTR
jgi:hypothetical protein